MKKIIATIAIAFLTLSAFAADKNVNQKVLDAFKSEFASATEVHWSAGNDYYKASFNYNGKYVYAYFDEQGKILGIARNLSPADLPFALQNNLKKIYEGFWVSELFETVKGEGTSYYITVENADTKIVLKSTDNNWNIYSKTKKS